MDEENLIIAAKEVRENAYAPYSNFRVGAALLGKSGKVFVGCNVENISFRLTICAEQAAIANALSAGEKEFQKIVVVADTTHPVMPCGGCRQTLAEFDPELEVVMVTIKGDREVAHL